MTGISAYGAYIPYTRLPLAMIGGGRARDGGPEKAVAFYDEDSVTMAVAAAVECLAGVDRATIDAIYFASTTYPFQEKQGAALIAKALDLRRDVQSADVSGSLRAGTTALFNAANAIAAGAARRVLVVASDCRMAAPGGALERNLGDGAAAFLVDDGEPVAVIDGRFSIADEIQDVWRSDGDAFTHAWEDRFAVSQGYARCVAEAVRGLLERLAKRPGDFGKLALYAPDARSHAAMARRLGFAGEQVQDPLFGRAGNSGAAFAPLLLVAALQTAGSGERILAASYGDGADALALSTTPLCDEAHGGRGVDWHLQRRIALKSYDSYLRSRGLQTKEWQAGNGGGLSATIRFRERDADITFAGGRCAACELVHFPQPRVCYRCHAKDRWTPYRLSDKRGRVMAFTFDHFFPSPEPPTIMTMVEIDGCRVQIQMCDARPDETRLDMPVEFVFRKIHDAGDKPNYFWKARPLGEE